MQVRLGCATSNSFFFVFFFEMYTHVQVLVEFSLKIGLADVNLGEVVISSGGHDEHKADGGRLYDGAEDAVKVDAELLGVAISN
jgi:hypothetical protein